MGLDWITLPSRISHDVVCFNPFKFAFRAYKDAWTLANKGKGVGKENLA